MKWKRKRVRNKAVSPNDVTRITAKQRDPEGRVRGWAKMKALSVRGMKDNYVK